VSDEQHDAPPGPARSGIALARQALAAARAEAKRRGLRPGRVAPPADRGEDPGSGTPPRRWRADLDERSGAHPDDRDPQLLGDTVDRLVAERGWETDSAVGAVMGRWPQIVGPEVAEHVAPVAFADGALVLAADSSAWATQMRLLAPTLLARLATELGAGTVTSVDVRGPSAPSWTRGRFTVRGRGPRDTYG
jgi:predicted nucleic acid-binding Zn ribbon protein